MTVIIRDAFFLLPLSDNRGGNRGEALHKGPLEREI